MTTVRNVSIVQKLVLASVLFCLMTLALGAYALHRSDGARRLAIVTSEQAVARTQHLMAMKSPLAVSEVEERRLRHASDAASRVDLVKSLDSERGRYQLAAGRYDEALRAVQGPLSNRVTGLQQASARYVSAVDDVQAALSTAELARLPTLLDNLAAARVAADRAIDDVMTVETSNGGLDVGAIAAYQNQSTLLMLSACIAISLVALKLALVMGRSLKVPLMRATALVESMAAGTLDQPITDRCDDENGALFKALEVARLQLRQRGDQLASTAADAARKLQGLDAASSSIMIVDADRCIVHVNKAMQGLLSVAEADIRAQASDFSASAVVGTSIDALKGLEPIARSLTAARPVSQVLDITIGTRTMSLVATPISSTVDAKMGYVIEWTDRTAALAEQARVAALSTTTSRIKQGLDAVETNVMIADADLNVVYINESIKAMLAGAERDIQKDVPAFNAAQVVGTSIDRFHKNPSRQRAMLSQLTTTFKTRLDLGGRSFSLIVNPITDSSGTRLGFVVEWREVTAELLQRQHDAENARRIEAISKAQAVIEFGMDGVIQGANDNFLNATGYTLAEIKGNHHSMFVDPVYRQSDEYKKFWEKLGRGEYEAAQYRRLGKNGREVWLQASYNPIFGPDGKPIKVVKYASDTTEHVLAAQALQQAVEHTQHVVDAARQGDLDARIPLEGKSGPVRNLCEGVNQLVESMGAVIGEVGRVFGALAEGDLNQTIDADYQGAFQRIKEDCNRSVQQLAQSVHQIKTATGTINSASREIAAGNNDLSARTEQQAASLEEAASSMEELTSTVKQNAENAKQANQLAIGASDIASRGGAMVGRVVTTMGAINESSKKIVDIISVIDGIAFQTNILALNAAVEAARAGEHGRGFAVVASEVRSLAQRSASAAKEIKTLIGDSVEKVDNGSKLVEQAGRTMDEIVTSVKRVTDIMAEISAASQEQSQGIEQVNQTITQMDEVTQQNAALVEQASAAARSLELQADGLAKAVGRFRLSADPSDAAPVMEVVRPVAPGATRRPISKDMARSRPSSNRAVPIRAPKLVAAGGSGDAKSSDQWTEF